MNRLYSSSQAFVDKYNAEYNCNLQIRQFSENGFSLPYISSSNIYIDKSTFIWVAFYYFGNPKLFHYYRLLKGLIDFNNVDGATKLLKLIKSEYSTSANRFEYLLSQHPAWIPSIVMVMTVHELAHHRFRIDKCLYERMMGEVYEFLQNKLFKISKEFVPDVDFNAAGIKYEEIREGAGDLYDAVIEDDMEDQSYLEELSADRFVFNYFSQAVRGCGVNTAIATMLALLGSCVFFLEFANRTNKLFITPINDSNDERIRNNLIASIIDSINSRIRAIHLDFFISNFWIEEKLDDGSRMLYSTLVGTPLSDFNESMDVEFMKSLQSFQNMLNEGGQIDFDKRELSDIREEADIFEESIISFILGELAKKDDYPFN